MVILDKKSIKGKKIIYLILLSILISFLFFIPKYIWAGTAGLCNPDSCFQWDPCCAGIVPACNSIVCYNCNGCPPTSSFLPGTLVSTIKGEKKIEDIKIGDRVLSFINDFITQSSVSKVHKTKKDYYYILKAGDYEVKATALHPFYIGNNQFKTVKDLKAGDYVYVLEDVPY